MDAWLIMVIVGYILLVGYSVFESLLYKKEHELDCFVHESNLVNKWILFLDNDLLVRVKGDFWVGYDAKQEKPYSVNCSNCSMGRYLSEERCQEILIELSQFLADDSRTVFEMPKE